jgi:hypothetical protein
MNRKEFVEQWRRFGTVKSIQDLALRGFNRLVTTRIYKGIVIDKVDPDFLKCEKGYRGEFLDHSSLLEIARKQPECELTETFLRDAFAKGDECYGFLDGDLLVNYGWYSNRPTTIDVPGLQLHFDPRYIYMYNGVTHKKYRGQRLHAISMTRALEAFLARGFGGIVSYVEWNNFGSLKSCYRMGYQDFGNLYRMRLFGKHLTWAGRGCARYQFRLEHVPEAEADRETTIVSSVPLTNAGGSDRGRDRKGAIV